MVASAGGRRGPLLKRRFIDTFDRAIRGRSGKRLTADVRTFVFWPHRGRGGVRVGLVATEDPWARPSKFVTVITLTLAIAALGVTSWYVWPGMPFTLVGLTVSTLLLGLPLATRWPITPRRAALSAIAWFVLGIPGGYLFGTAVLLASLLLGLGVCCVRLAAHLTREEPATV
jgi:hypothetical protein